MATPSSTSTLSFFRIHSLRVRLALWHAGLLAVTLISLAALTLVLLRSFLSSRADEGLLDYAETTARDIATQLYQASLSGKTELPRYLNPDLQEWGRQLQVIDRYGAIKDRSDGLRTHHIPPEMTPRIEAQKGNVYFETRNDLGE